MFAKGNETLAINETGIAWKSDTSLIFHRAENYSETQWTDVENEHFPVWMRTALLPNFRKLWGRIDSNLYAGNYTIFVENNYDVSNWEGEKYFVLSTANSLGGTTKFLGYLLLAGAAACWVVIGLFLLKNKVSPIPPYDDLTDLHWD